MCTPTHIHPYISESRVVNGSRWRTDRASYSGSHTPGTSLLVQRFPPPGTGLEAQSPPICTHVGPKSHYSRPPYIYHIHHYKQGIIPASITSSHTHTSCSLIRIIILRVRINITVIAQQIQEVAPTDSRGGPHRVVWHFVPCGTLL